MNDATIIATINDAARELHQLRTTIRPRLAAIDTARQGWPPGKGFDAPAGRGNVSFCETHEKEHCDCGSGTTYATATDTTGDAALRPDPAKADRDHIERLAKNIRKQADELATILGRYAPREATDTERRDTLGGGQSQAGCWSCARTQSSRGITRWEPAARTIDIDGQRRPLCWWCLDYVRKGTDGKAPTASQVDQHHRGIRVTRSA